MSKKILLIEDNEQDQLIMKRYLNQAGYTDILVADNGEQGIKKAVSEGPDLIVLDTLLPDMDGFAVCERLRKSKVTSKIVMNTGHIDAVDAGRARQSGADDYVVKTTDYTYLIDAIQKNI